MLDCVPTFEDCHLPTLNCSGFLGAILAHPGGTYQILGLMKVCAPSNELALRLLFFVFFLVRFLGHNYQISEVPPGSEFRTHSWQAWVVGTLWGAGDWSGSVVITASWKNTLFTVL